MDTLKKSLINWWIKISDMLLQAVLRNDYGSYVLNLRKIFNRLYFIVNLPLWSAIMSIEENSLNDIMCPTTIPHYLSSL